MYTFYSQGLNFTCTRCSCCCRHESGYVYISKKDLTKLLVRFNLNEREFIDRYCRWIDFPNGTQVLSLREKENLDCILWSDGCIAYDSRPLQCSTFPFWDRLLISPDDWNAAAIDCPGMNNGKKYTATEIEQIAFLHRNNKPLCRTDFTGEL